MTARIKARKHQVAKRRPVFTCPAHPTPLAMTYSADENRWVCSDPNCRLQRKPAATAETAIIREAPKLVLREDEDGDYHAFLYWENHEIIIEIPFSQKRVTTTPSHTTLEWDFDSGVVERYGRGGLPL